MRLSDHTGSNPQVPCFFSFVLHLLYLSFYNCVPDPDTSINKLGLSILNQAQAMFMFRPGLGGGRASGPLGLPRHLFPHSGGIKMSNKQLL